MSNCLQVETREQVVALIRLGWSDRRIGREVGVHRSTVAKCREAAAPKPAKVFPGSGPGSAGSVAAAPRSRSLVEAYRESVLKGLRKDLTARRIWQDLVEAFGYGGSYESVKRFVRTLVPERRTVGERGHGNTRSPRHGHIATWSGALSVQRLRLVVTDDH